MSLEKTISINGAGVGGLTLAIGLAKFGHRVVIAEKQSAISEFGAGLQISPNARRVLNAFGLDGQISANSFEPEAIDIFSSGGNAPLTSINLGETAKKRYENIPYCVMHRADLVQQLYAATKKFPNIEILFDVTDTHVEQTADGVSVIIEREDKAPYPVSARAHIGADGVRSLTRTRILEGPRPQYSGFIAWRALADIKALEGLLPTNKTSLFWGRDYHMVIYPLTQRNQFNIVLITKQPLSRDKDTPRICDKSLIKNKLLLEIMESVSSPWTNWPLFGVKTPKWFERNVAILGDAAHAMLPFQAQGAAMAIEDAGLLAVLMAANPSNAETFKQWQNLRQPRVSKIQTTSEKNGAIFHMPSFLSWTRDAIVARQSQQAHLERLDGIYAHDPFEGMLA